MENMSVRWGHPLQAIMLEHIYLHNVIGKTKMKKTISILEIDARDARYQSGIATYFNVLRESMPSHISTYSIVFYRSPEFKDVKITNTDNELQIYHPIDFPIASLFDAVFTYVYPKLRTMQNLIVKSDCLSCEGLAYLIKSRIYCKTVGVLHCQPNMNLTPGFVPADPYFNMDEIILVGDNGIKYMDYWRCRRPYHVIYNGVDTPKMGSKKPNDGVFRFIFANGFAKHKGFAKIVPAIRAVAKKHKIEVTVLGGYAREDEALFNEIADLPIIKLGLVDDMSKIRECYERADAALFASRTEACSFAGIEAMAYNLPIVSTNESAMVEMFDKAALFVDMDAEHNINTSQYAAEMMRVIEDKKLRLRLSVGAYSRFLSRYTRKKMIADTIALYENLVK